MSENRLAVVVLAAGLGTRMKSQRPKVLHEVAGRPMLSYVLDSVATLAPERVVVVVGRDMAEVAALARPFPTVVQDPPLGTGHAVIEAMAALEGYHGATGFGDVLVVYGDTPLLSPETLARLVARRREEDAPALVGLAFRPGDPAQYGRVSLDGSGRVMRVVEFADAGEEERANDLCNGGILLADAPLLYALLGRCDRDNAKGEIYLTDVYDLAYQMGLDGRVVEAPPEEVLGVNSRADLAVAEAVLQTRLRGAAMAGGTSLLDPTTVWLAADTAFGRDVTVEPYVFFGPGVTVGDGARICAFSHLVGARIGAGARVGPFARLRPGAELGPEARIGNFVEVKNATLGPGAKANHLAYVGDAEVGAGANVGAGTITCNYDGFAKQRTKIGAGAFIGSNSALVAPVEVGPGALVGAGSTITKDVGEDALALGRARQVEIAGGARHFRARQGAPAALKSEDS